MAEPGEARRPSLQDNPAPKPEANKHTVPPSVASRRPDLSIPPPSYRLRDNFYFLGAADLRYRTLTRNSESVPGTNGSYVAAMRFTGEYIRANPVTGDERGGIRLQLLAEPGRPGGTALNRVRPSEAYAFYRFLFPGVSATLRGGQFVLPFGLIAVYDTPLQPIQPLYEKALGLRVDTGLMLEGDYGPYHYAGSITTGAGPNRSDPDSNKVIAFRLSRQLATRIGLFQVGGSLLTGRLPKTGFETELLPSGTVIPQLVAVSTLANSPGIERAIEYVNKTRFAGDGEYRRGNLSARGEIIFGGDDDERANTQDPVWGYFAEGNYRVRPRLTLVGVTRRWNFPARPQKATMLGGGANFTLGGGVLLRALYEFERLVPPPGTERDSPTIIRRLTLQTRLTF
jgi:hypothetical protein